MTAPWFWSLPADRPDLSPPVATLTDGVLTVHLSGDLDAGTQAEMQTALYDLLSSHTARYVVLDLAGLQFCDSAGLRILLRAHHLAVARGAGCRIERPQPHIAALLRITGADAIVNQPPAPSDRTGDQSDADPPHAQA